MKELYLLCNAHLDPVWLWRREEGMAEAISTFRVAADFCEQYDGFVFNHNESLVYQWVEEHEPELFVRIQNLVKSGKWNIMGGWYLQPDCLMPSGESFLRQIEVGQKYFSEKFSCVSKTAVNVDSFGHTRGLVQILKKCGYENYIFMRPYSIVPEHDFIWVGYDGSEINGHCLSGSYGTLKGDIIPRIERELKTAKDGANLVLWGVGNHGGGPSKLDLDSIAQYQKEHPEIRLIHSSCEDYFQHVSSEDLSKNSHSMVHCNIGCYTSMVQIKQQHRQLENEFSVCEKMIAVSDIAYDEKEWEKAEKALLFSEFHDVLAGTVIKKAEEDALRLLGYGREVLSESMGKAFLKLCRGQKKAEDGTIPIFVFYPHPYSSEQEIEAEFQLANQNWNDNEVTVARVYDENGTELAAQNIKEESCMNLDWRKKIIFRAKLKPMSLNRFCCKLETAALPKRPIAACEEENNCFVYRNESMEILINKTTGLLDRYRVNGVDYLEAESAAIAVYDDNEDPWQMTTDGFYNRLGNFKLLSADEGNAFNGYPSETGETVRVIENGKVVLKIQAIFRYGASYAVVTYTIPKQGKHVDIHIKMLSNDVNRMYKLVFRSSMQNVKFVGQTAFGREELLQDGKEVVYQKWCGLFEEEKSFAVFNRGNYGGSFRDGQMEISLLRTPIYAAHPIGDRQLSDSDRCHDHIDMGEREFDFRLLENAEDADCQAEIFNQQPYVLSFFPSGEGEAVRKELSISNRNVLLSCFRKQKDGNYLIRLFHASDKEEQATICLFGTNSDICMKPYELKSFIATKQGELREANSLLG